MRLDQDKIRLIIILHEKTEFKTKTISKLVKISRRRIQIKQYKETGKLPELKKPSRKSKPIPEDIKNLILKAHSESKYQGPVHLERWIEENYGVHIPHNTIYKVFQLNVLLVPLENSPGFNFPNHSHYHTITTRINYQPTLHCYLDSLVSKNL